MWLKLILSNNTLKRWSRTSQSESVVNSFWMSGTISFSSSKSSTWLYISPFTDSAMFWARFVIGWAPVQYIILNYMHLTISQIQEPAPPPIFFLLFSTNLNAIHWWKVFHGRGYNFWKNVFHSNLVHGVVTFLKGGVIVSSIPKII